MEKIKNQDLFNLYLHEINDFSGWDFSYLTQSDRMGEFPLKWNYTNEIKKYLKKVDSLLDMGTGGGEFLSSLNPLPKCTWAIEGYEPNVLIAKNRLEPLGVKVYKITDDENLPFSDSTFALIINRHESFSSKELYRILKPNSLFITQQVGGLNDKEINELLGTEKNEYFDWSLRKAVNQLVNNNFKILKQKVDFSKTRFYDIGAIIYYLKANPWQIPDFSVEKYYDKLINIHNFIQDKGYIDFTKHRFFIISQKI